MPKKPTYCGDCDNLRNDSEFCSCGNCIYGCCGCEGEGDIDPHDLDGGNDAYNEHLDIRP